MGIVQDVQIGSSTHFFILPEEELSVLYPEISDFTGCVNAHAEQDSGQLRRAVEQYSRRAFHDIQSASQYKNLERVLFAR